LRHARWIDRAVNEALVVEADHKTADVAVVQRLSIRLVHQNVLRRVVADLYAVFTGISKKVVIAAVVGNQRRR
jgi:hypothetical protein